MSRALQTPRTSAPWQAGDEAKATPRNTDTEYKAGRLVCWRIEASSLVLLLLIQTCLRWLLPATLGIESPVTRANIAQPAIKKIAAQQHIDLAPFHAPPPRLPG